MPLAQNIDNYSHVIEKNINNTIELNTLNSYFTVFSLLLII